MDKLDPKEMDELFSVLARHWGKRGGEAAAAAMTPQQRAERGRKAIQLRWMRHREKQRLAAQDREQGVFNPAHDTDVPQNAPASRQDAPSTAVEGLEAESIDHFVVEAAAKL